MSGEALIGNTRCPGHKVLHKNEGSAPGNPMSAFRSELYGVVTWYCCLVHVMEYLNISSTVHITPYTDNVKVIKYHQHMITKSTQLFPFFDDYDLYYYMESYHKRLIKHGITIQLIQKIESNATYHQELSLPQRLHQQVDSAAKHYRKNQSISSHILPPLDIAHLINIGGSVMSNEKYILETSWSMYNIEQYYADRWELAVPQLSNFDWSTYASIYSTSRPSIQVFIIKIMTGWLPVHHHVNKMTTSKKYCYHCHKNETIAHLFQCSSRQQWRTYFEQQLLKRLKQINTPSRLVDDIIQHFHDIIHSPKEYPLFRHFTPFAGLLPQKWQDIYASCPETHSQPHKKWTTTLGRWLIQQSHKLWITRNDEIHKKDNNISTMDRILNQKI